MANEEQVALLRQGAEVWNQWREANPDAEIDLSGANLSGADLRRTNLSGVSLRDADLHCANLSYTYLEGSKLEGADLTGASLRKAYFSGAKLYAAKLYAANLEGADLTGARLVDADLHCANLSYTNLEGASLNGARLSGADFSGARLSGTCLSGTDLSDVDLKSADFRKANYFIGANLSGTNLIDANLFRSNLCRAKLSGANLSGANLMATDLRGANLFKANLRASQVLNAYFKRATLTGACIADWQMGSSTNLESVKCDYIFRTYDPEENKFTGRLPVDPDSTFAPGEFEQWIQVRKGALDTIDITFTEGIDWQAFFTSLETVRRQHPDANVAMKSVEEDGGIFVARLKVETEVEGEALTKLKADIETQIKASYGMQLAAAHGEIKALERSLDNALEKLAMTSNNEIHQTFQGPVGNVAGKNQGNMHNIQHIYAAEQQDLSEAAKEIQKLLNTLAETYNTTTDAGQGLLMQQFDQEVKQHPKWRRALKEGGIELMKLLFPPISIPWEMAMVYLEEDE